MSKKSSINESLYEGLGKRIANKRKSLGLTQRELSKFLGLSRASVANIEVGRQRPTVATLYNIADFLNCDPRSLVPNNLHSSSEDSDFSVRLKYARSIVRKISQKDLSAMINLPASQISHFETGQRRPSFDNLVKIAVALDISCDYLVGLSDDVICSGYQDSVIIAFDQLNEENKSIAEKFIKFLYGGQS